MALPYAQVRNSVAIGDVLLFSGRGFWSRIISARTASPITHAGLAAWWHGRLFVLEAVERIGVRVYPLSEHLRLKSSVVRWYALDSGFNRTKILNRALGHVGRRYADWRQFVRSWGLGIGRFFGLAADTDPERFFCSEFVADALQAGAPVGHGLHTWEPPTTSPGDLVFCPSLQLRGELTI